MKKNLPPTSPDSLSPADQTLLRECEDEIRDNITGWYIVGQRLMQIQEAKLYRQTHDSFEKYCREMWSFSRPQAYRLIAAHQCTAQLRGLDDDTLCVPVLESQARELVELSAADRIVVAREVKLALGSSKLVAADFRAARSKLFPSEPTKSKAKDCKPKTCTPETLVVTLQDTTPEVTAPSIAVSPVATSPFGSDASSERVSNLETFLKGLLARTVKWHELSVEAYNNLCNSEKRQQVERALNLLRYGLKDDLKLLEQALQLGEKPSGDLASNGGTK